MSETEAFATAAEVPPSGPAPETGGGTAPEPPPSKPRSGFGRMKIKVARLTELYENMRNDYEAVCVEHDRLLADYAKLELAFNEITELNTELASELRQLKQHRPNPVRYGTLMGGM